MHTAKVTTLKAALQTKQQKQEGTSNGVGESFRVLYYGSASAGSVPFMWESQPGTPKHALTESSLPPLTPPPSYHQLTQKYNSSMQVINHQSSKRSGFFGTIFFYSSRKRNMATAPPSSLSSCSDSSSSWGMSAVEEEDGDGGSPTSTLCLGGEFKKNYRMKKMKKAMLSFVRNGKA
ncbi:hypothetical protein L1987_35321 [Smallanthus sonchifolius]|uniref:Uncharacterized protein n=1 Tax=Smallanthus sonchifolius TaxID=185202 RepID=A0ACB9HY12_9ASTR|nr:hypothetical protein L1987_35321 [Smallanthus sonchifolius]